MTAKALIYCQKYKAVKQKGVKNMKNARIALRLTQTERKRLEALIKTGKFKTISEIVREALKQFLDTQVGSNIRSLKTNCMRENY